MKIKFTKMHGCGNDYIYINCFEQKLPNPKEFSKKFSKRRYYIGSDGLILICPSDVADAKMRMFNSDGSEGKMCGNGIRCVGKFLHDKNIVSSDDMTVETLSGIKKVSLISSDGLTGVLRVDMGPPNFLPSSIPILTNKKEVICERVSISGVDHEITCLSMGNPHCIVFVSDLDSVDIENIGPLFEKNRIFPEGINTEFVKVIDDRNIRVRVWERGSGETLACGTGACASVVACVKNGFCKKSTDIKVSLSGGNLTVNYNDSTVYMAGEAETVFEGELEI